MKVSLSWLKKYVSIDLDVDRLVDALTMVGLEVESATNRYAYLDSVVVGRITAINDHPNADKLRLCDVDIGNRTVSIVCGAPNIEVDMCAPVALPGTVFPDGSILKQSAIRGVESAGMICSENELGLGLDTSGVMVLDPKLSPGDKLQPALALSDTLIDIDLTPNRPDCLSIIGVAREIAAIQNSTIQYPDYNISDNGQDIDKLTSVSILAPDLCPRYTARMIVDISIGPSPFWLQDNLMSIGLRPINNIVDITNFVMMETGQPLHAFDFDQLAENRIVVRAAEEGERFTTLDEKERRLNAEMLMICDGEKPVGVGGVMGGMNSEIENSTTRVLLESAYFNPVSIRKTAKKLGLNTEASHRFERGVDPSGTVNALNRASQMMVELAGGRLVSGFIDEHPKPTRTKQIPLNLSATNRLLGTRLDAETVTSLLESIELKVSPVDEDQLLVDPPPFRVDISRPEDLMEEVARLSGYNNISITYPKRPAEGRPQLLPLVIRNRIRRLMCGFGFSEAITYSFVSRDACDRLALDENDPRRSTVEIMNPLSEEQAVMRTSMIPGLLETMHRNLSRQERHLKLFEIGKVYYGKGPENQPHEVEMLAGLWSGSRSAASWHAGEVPCDFFDLKGVADGLLKAMRIDDIDFISYADASCSYTKPGHSAQVMSGKEQIGLIGEVHPRVLQNFDLKQAAYIFELNIDSMMPLIPQGKQSRSIPRYPAVSRDATLIIDKNIASRQILKRVEQLDEPLIEGVHLFDVFEGKPIPAGSKSISYRIIYRSDERTLEDDEINGLHKAVTERLLKEFNASLPV
jgi:phenylalanyl-tRNA synthetase beta chain